MTLKLSIVFCLLMLFYSIVHAQYNSPGVIISNGKHYLAGKVVVKLKESNPRKLSATPSTLYSIRQKMQSFNISDIKPYFKSSKTDEGELSSIIEISYSTKDDPEIISKDLEQSGDVEWAEPHYVYRLTYVPDDPSYTEQWGLKKILAEDAWEISQGDTSVIIGISDSGVDWDHPDLAANIWTNYDEVPNNGIDDDNNGYADDIRGWDFGGGDGTADNDPAEFQPDHGTHVAGIASAVTNNGTGVASIGSNCKLMPVKTCIDNFRDPDGRPYVVFGFEAIVYAADNGAQIINCSWGGTEYSKAGEEAIKYAAEKGALVIVSAGNNSSEGLFYPACYKDVFSVASTTSDDKLSSFSNYGYHVDVSAPGSLIYSTWMDNTYETLSGTSMASPLVAGLAGLVKSRFPNYTNYQVAEQIRVNTDNIDFQNPSMEKKIGSGRINAYKTLADSGSISVRASSLYATDEPPYGNGNGVFEAGETISLGASFLNILNPFESMNVSIESMDTNLVVLNGVYTVGATAMLDSFNNFSNKYTMKIKPGTPENSTIPIMFKYSSGDYRDYQMDSIAVNQTFQTQSGGKIAMTITSSGNLGFNDFWENKQGIGFSYDRSRNLLYEGAFMFGNSAEYISDAARGITAKDSDFQMINPFILFNSDHADVEGHTSFSDIGAGEQTLDIETILLSYSWNDSPYDSFIILRYKMINNHDTDITNFYSGLYLDWNISDTGIQSDVAAFDENKKLGYVFKIAGQPPIYAGCALLNPLNCNYYAISNGGGDGGISVYAGSGGFTNQEKWLALTNGTSKRLAENTDVSFVISSGPDEIRNADTLEVAFAIAAADNLKMLKEAIDQAKNKYNLITGNITEAEEDITQPLRFYLVQNYPNPFNPETNIEFDLDKSGQVTLKIYDIIGREIAVLLNEPKEQGHYKLTFDGSRLASGIYYYSLISGKNKQFRKMVLLK